MIGNSFTFTPLTVMVYVVMRFSHRNRVKGKKGKKLHNSFISIRFKIPHISTMETE